MKSSRKSIWLDERVRKTLSTFTFGFFFVCSIYEISRSQYFKITARIQKFRKTKNGKMRERKLEVKALSEFWIRKRKDRRDCRGRPYRHRPLLRTRCASIFENNPAGPELRFFKKILNLTRNYVGRLQENIYLSHIFR